MKIAIVLRHLHAASVVGLLSDAVGHSAIKTASSIMGEIAMESSYTTVPGGSPSSGVPIPFSCV